MTIASPYQRFPKKENIYLADKDTIKKWDLQTKTQ
jgi:hypothetical protein